MTEIDVRAFLLTVSVRGDISPECTRSLVSYISKSCVHSYVVVERGQNGQRHLHAAMVFKTPKSKKQLRNNLWGRHVQVHHPDSIGAVAVKLQVMPGHKWYDEYLRKESGVEVLLDTYDRDAVSGFLPTPEEQVALVEAASSSRNDINGWWSTHVAGWTASPFTDDAIGAIYYLKDCMHKDIIQVIKDDRILTDTAYSLWERRHKILTPSNHQVSLLARKDDANCFQINSLAARSAAPPSI